VLLLDGDFQLGTNGVEVESMSEMVETALRLLLRSWRKQGTLPTLPSFPSGGALVDIADRDALYQAMEGR
jgi:hypothetical protein